MYFLDSHFTPVVLYPMYKGPCFVHVTKKILMEKSVCMFNYINRTSCTVFDQPELSRVIPYTYDYPIADMATEFRLHL